MTESRYKAYDPLKCLNCDTAFEAETKFCPSCGQKNRKHELKLGEWIREGLSTFFHLEGKTWNTVRDLAVPGKIADNYFNGKRERYVHPFRLLVFSSLICFGLISLRGYYDPDDDPTSFINRTTTEDGEEIDVQKVSYTSPKIIRSLNLHPISARMKSIDLLRSKVINHDRFLLIADSMRRAGASQDSAQLALLDTLANFYEMPTNWAGTGNLSIAGDTLTFDPRQVASFSAREVVADAEINGWLVRLISRKALVAFQEGSDSVYQQLYGNLSWAVLLYVPLLAFGYKLLYLKKLPLYTQHLTYSSILMSIALLLFGLSSFLRLFTTSSIVPIGILLVFLAFNFISDRRVFQISYMHAIAKSAVLGFYGFFAFIIALLCWFFLSMLFI